jgi:molecular chaperone GrpE
MKVTDTDPAPAPDAAEPRAQPSAAPRSETPEFRVVDKRLFANPDTLPPATAAEEKPRFPTFVEELMGRVAETERRYEEKRRQVDEEIGRLRARLEAESERRLGRAVRDIVLPLLEVLDNLERTLAAAEAGAATDRLVEGVALVAGQFRGRLRDLGVEPIRVLDEPFDPNVSEAIGTVPVAEPEREGLVIEEVLRGYRLGEELLRPARVRVAQRT